MALQPGMAVEALREGGVEYHSGIFKCYSDSGGHCCISFNDGRDIDVPRSDVLIIDNKEIMRNNKLFVVDSSKIGEGGASVTTRYFSFSVDNSLNQGEVVLEDDGSIDRSVLLHAHEQAMCLGFALIASERNPPVNPTAVPPSPPIVESGPGAPTSISVDPLELPSPLAEVSPPRVVFLGGGACVVPMCMKTNFPHLLVDVVEIDPDVVEMATSYFGVTSSPAEGGGGGGAEPAPAPAPSKQSCINLYTQDGLDFIRRRPPSTHYDIIVLDAGDKGGAGEGEGGDATPAPPAPPPAQPVGPGADSQSELRAPIPPDQSDELRSRVPPAEFMSEASVRHLYDALESGGVLVVNAIEETATLRRIQARLRTRFQQVFVYLMTSTEDGGNCVLFARKLPPPPQPTPQPHLQSQSQSQSQPPYPNNPQHSAAEEQGGEAGGGGGGLDGPQAILEAVRRWDWRHSHCGGRRRGGGDGQREGNGKGSNTGKGYGGGVGGNANCSKDNNGGNDGEEGGEGEGGSELVSLEALVWGLFTAES